MGEVRQYHDSLLKFFCLTFPKSFLEEPFCAVFQENWSGKEVYG